MDSPERESVVTAVQGLKFSPERGLLAWARLGQVFVLNANGPLVWLLVVWTEKHEMSELLFMYDVCIKETFLIGWWNVYKVWVGRNSMVLLESSLGFPLMDVIPWAFLGGVYGGASFIGLNSMNLEARVHGGAYATGRNSTRIMWWCLTTRT